MPELSLASVAVIGIALALGGVLKGATGAGLPVIAVPVIAAFMDVRLAVAVVSVVNLFTNTGQLWSYRAELLPGRFTAVLSLSAGLGAIAGTVLLASLPPEGLMLIVALSVCAYIALRLAVPSFVISQSRAERLAAPVGLLGGLMQGAAGISAPVSVSFLNAMRLARPVFIATISAFFLVMSLTQTLALMVAGILGPALFALGIAALLPAVLCMPVGTWMSRHLTPAAFDRLVLTFLSLLALKLFADALL